MNSIQFYCRAIHIHRVIPVLLITCIAGCSTCPKASRYFDRLTPYDTVNGFVYAVETGQWEFVYDCISSEDREHDISELEIQVYISYFKDPFGIPIKDIILNAERDRGRVKIEYNKEKAFMILQYDGVSAKGFPVSRGIRLYLINESIDGSEKLWRIHFERSLPSPQAAASQTVVCD